jgi:hypothetical protein
LNDDKKNKWNFSKSKHSKNFKNSFEHTNSWKKFFSNVLKVIL